MAENTITIDSSVYAAYAGPLDAKLATLSSFAELRSIPNTDRYVGMTVAVVGANSAAPCTEYWLVGGTKNPNWKVKAGNVVPTIEDLNAISSAACIVGLEMIVQSDSTNEGKVTKYWVTAIDTVNKTVTWDRKQYGGGGAAVTVEGEDIEPANE